MLSCVVMYHSFYDDVVMPDLRPLADKRIIGGIYINRVMGENRNVIGEDLPKGVLLRHSPNCGKDIGGKMVLIDSFLRKHGKSDWIIFLHDKKSLHKSTGEAWKKKLWKIISKEFIEQALITISNNPDIAMIGPKSCKNQWGRNETDSSDMIVLVDKLSEKYNINKVEFCYVAGGMFWMKADIIRTFFSKWNPLAIRATLEKGNVLDNDRATVTHAWERLFGRIVESHGGKAIFF